MNSHRFQDGLIGHALCWGQWMVKQPYWEIVPTATKQEGKKAALVAADFLVQWEQNNWQNGDAAW